MANPKPKPTRRQVVRREIVEELRVKLHAAPDKDRETKNEILAIMAWINRRV